MSGGSSFKNTEQFNKENSLPWGFDGDRGKVYLSDVSASVEIPVTIESIATDITLPVFVDGVSGDASIGVDINSISTGLTLPVFLDGVSGTVEIPVSVESVSSSVEVGVAINDVSAGAEFQVFFDNATCSAVTGFFTATTTKTVTLLAAQGAGTDTQIRGFSVWNQSTDTVIKYRLELGTYVVASGGLAPMGAFNWNKIGCYAQRTNAAIKGWMSGASTTVWTVDYKEI